MNRRARRAIAIGTCIVGIAACGKGSAPAPEPARLTPSSATPSSATPSSATPSSAAPSSAAPGSASPSGVTPSSTAPSPGAAGGAGSATPSGATRTWAEPAASNMVAAACTALPFAASTPLAEASGAAWITVDRKPALLVISDSGNHGDYAVLDPDTGATVETGRLPLPGDAGDDLEGVAVRGDKIYGLTSSGWIRVWRRADRGFTAVTPAYPLGPVDLPAGKSGNLDGKGMVCPGTSVNCGRDYEGLCLAPSPRGGCAGFAASRADGRLYCLTDEAGKLVVHHDRAIAITRPKALADCAFSDDGTLWAGSNMFDLGHVYRVARWDDPAHAEAVLVGSLGVGFPEGIAARGDVVYRFSDMGGAPSLIARYRCPAAP